MNIAGFREREIEIQRERERMGVKVIDTAIACMMDVDR